MRAQKLVCGILAVALAAGGCSKKPRRDAADELHYAVRSGDLGHVQALIVRGIPVNGQGTWGRTPRDEAIRQRHADIVQLLTTKAAAAKAGVQDSGTKK